jgi:hypothetical protein
MANREGSTKCRVHLNFKRNSEDQHLNLKLNGIYWKLERFTIHYGLNPVGPKTIGLGSNSQNRGALHGGATSAGGVSTSEGPVRRRRSGLESMARCPEMLRSSRRWWRVQTEAGATYEHRGARRAGDGERSGAGFGLPCGGCLARGWTPTWR